MNEISKKYSKYIKHYKMIIPYQDCTSMKCGNCLKLKNIDKHLAQVGIYFEYLPPMWVDGVYWRGRTLPKKYLTENHIDGTCADLEFCNAFCYEEFCEKFKVKIIRLIMEIET